MKINPDDPRLTAYALGELDSDEQAEIERLIKDLPDCQKAIEEIRETARVLTHEYSQEPDLLLHSAQRRDIEDFHAKNRIPLKLSRRLLVTGSTAIAASITLLFIFKFGFEDVKIKQIPFASNQVAPTNSNPSDPPQALKNRSKTTEEILNQTISSPESSSPSFTESLSEIREQVYKNESELEADKFKDSLTHLYLQDLDRDGEVGDIPPVPTSESATVKVSKSMPSNPVDHLNRLDLPEVTKQAAPATPTKEQVASSSDGFGDRLVLFREEEHSRQKLAQSSSEPSANFTETREFYVDHFSTAIQPPNSTEPDKLHLLSAQYPNDEAAIALAESNNNTGELETQRLMKERYGVSFSEAQTYSTSLAFESKDINENEVTRLYTSIKPQRASGSRNTASYPKYIENEFLSVFQNPLST